MEHDVFGPGTILEADDWHITILFDESGTRKFVTSIVKLVRSDIPAPAKPVRRKKATTKKATTKKSSSKD